MSFDLVSDTGVVHCHVVVGQDGGISEDFFEIMDGGRIGG